MNGTTLQLPPAARLMGNDPREFPPLGANESDLHSAQAQYEANLKKAGKGELYLGRQPAYERRKMAFLARPKAVLTLRVRRSLGSERPLSRSMQVLQRYATALLLPHQSERS